MFLPRIRKKRKPGSAVHASKPGDSLTFHPNDATKDALPMMQAAALRITKILTVIDGDEIEEDDEAKTGRRRRA